MKIIEEMLIDFYTGVVQNLSKYEAPAPKINEKRELKNIDNVENQEAKEIAASSSESTAAVEM